jgi:hypothetical protein
MLWGRGLKVADHYPHPSSPIPAALSGSAGFQPVHEQAGCLFSRLWRWEACSEGRAGSRASLALPSLPLYVIGMAPEDGFGPVELLQEHQPGQFVGEGQAGEGQLVVGEGLGGLIQAQVPADEKGQGPAVLFPPGQPGGEFLGGIFFPPGSRATTYDFGGIWPRRRSPSLALITSAVRFFPSFSSRTAFKASPKKGFRR